MEEYTHSTHVGFPTVQRSAIIRFDTKNSIGNVVPRLHVNPTHHSLGDVSVSVDWDHRDRPVKVTAPGGWQIQSVQVTCDETMVKNGFRAGPSGGGNVTKITIVRPRIIMVNGRPEIDNEVIPAASARLYDPYANLWVHWFLCGCEADLRS